MKGTDVMRVVSCLSDQQSFNRGGGGPRGQNQNFNEFGGGGGGGGGGSDSAEVGRRVHPHFTLITMQRCVGLASQYHPADRLGMARTLNNNAYYNFI